MRVRELKIPDTLCRLIESGIWPNANTPWQEINRQSISPVLSVEAARALSPIYDHIVMMKPPFHTIADEVAGGNSFWVSGVTNPSEINYEKAVIIADFGMGSDSPIVLYYVGENPPVIMYLQWTGSGDNIRQNWIQTHESFEDFSVAIGLKKAQPIKRFNPSGGSGGF